MRRPFAAIVLAALLAVSLGACTKCGWIWNDYQHACHSDAPR
jgi:hypothetical protein